MVWRKKGKSRRRGGASSSHLPFCLLTRFLKRSPGRLSHRQGCLGYAGRDDSTCGDRDGCLASSVHAPVARTRGSQVARQHAARGQRHVDVAAHLLEPEESLDSEETGIDLDEGYSPPERPRELGAWGLIASEARTHESLARRLAREVPDVTDRWDGDGIGDSADTDGEPIDDQVGDSRAGRLVAFGVDPTDPTTDYRAHDVGIDGGAASAEEAAMHIIAD